MTMKCDLDIESAKLSFAHQINEMNIWVKFNENGSKGEEMWSEQKLSVNHITLKCNIDIKFAQPDHRLCTLAICKEHLGEV